MNALVAVEAKGIGAMFAPLLLCRQPSDSFSLGATPMAPYGGDGYLRFVVSSLAPRPSFDLLFTTRTVPMAESSSGAGGVGGSDAASNVNAASQAQKDAEVSALAETAIAAAQRAAEAALDAERTCKDPAAAQAAAQAAQQAAKAAEEAAQAVDDALSGLITSETQLAAKEESAIAAYNAAQSARSAQEAAQEAAASLCEGVPMSQAPSPTQGLSLATINQLS
ncbi:hypothetical protein K4L06_06065 [Lysobacter sp. BMK333-48F3]|uniref:hypothetical protein n=1 Tax=Lysobacter sp. BMK333-48F3 TaxID=2867962 RepID=UPI001C8B3385|nr:hypothetical protein [Lysobacter sp. BMK333-48F3]MBX9400871.1 hypothetical protein [Lysobacter sp. BMK333-48F3]